jgi:hypothetical protein
MSGTRLWIALTDHVVVPGTVVTVHRSKGEPSDRSIKARAAAPGVKPSELEVVGVFDLSWILDRDERALRLIAAEANRLLAKRRR